MNVTCCYDGFKMLRPPPLVETSTRTVLSHILHNRDFQFMSPPNPPTPRIKLLQKLYDIKKCHPLKWPISSLETNMRYIVIILHSCGIFNECQPNVTMRLLSIPRCSPLVSQFETNGIYFAQSTFLSYATLPMASRVQLQLTNWITGNHEHGLRYKSLRNWTR